MNTNISTSVSRIWLMQCQGSLSSMPVPHILQSGFLTRIMSPESTVSNILTYANATADDVTTALAVSVASIISKAPYALEAFTGNHRLSSTTSDRLSHGRL
jgi:hypothetical protein